MQDTKPTQNQNNNVPEKPRMTKPVTGEFKKNQKKLGTMMRQNRQVKKGDK